MGNFHLLIGMFRNTNFKIQYLSFGYCLLPFACCLLLLASCKPIAVYEKNTVIPKYEWDYNFAATGSFVINDTLAAYNIYLVIRHTDAYRYNNIWLNIGLQPPGDTMNFQKTDLQLGTDDNGWEGTGMNDIWEVRKSLNDKPSRFIKPGTYNFKISHIMRENPLLYIMSAGIRVEKK